MFQLQGKNSRVEEQKRQSPNYVMVALWRRAGVAVTGSSIGLLDVLKEIEGTFGGDLRTMKRIDRFLRQMNGAIQVELA